MDNERLWDDDSLGAIGATSPAPQTVEVLFELAGVSDAPRQVKESALAEWVARHKPSKMLTRSIELAGYSSVLTGTLATT